MKRLVGLVILLSLFWLILSPFLKTWFLVMMFITLVLSVWIVRRMHVVDREALPFHLAPRILQYWAWLLKEIVVANIDTVRRILGLGAQPAPAMRRIDVSGMSEMEQVIYANSITLTPGTVSVDFDGETLEVHALHFGSLDDLARDGEMASRVDRLEDNT